MDDNCTDATKQCDVEKYAELSWDHLENSQLKNQSVQYFWNNTWTPTVMKAFPDVDETVFKNVITHEDHANTDSRTRLNWKYGTSNGVYGTPSAFVNGVMVDVPASVADWDHFLRGLFAPTMQQEKDLFLL